MYKLLEDTYTKRAYGASQYQGDNPPMSFVFDPANTDYQKFKVDVADGVELQDPDGNVMTQAEVDAFLKTIP